MQHLAVADEQHLAVELVLRKDPTSPLAVELEVTLLRRHHRKMGPRVASARTR